MNGMFGIDLNAFWNASLHQQSVDNYDVELPTCRGPITNGWVNAIALWWNSTIIL